MKYFSPLFIALCFSFTLNAQKAVILKDGTIVDKYIDSMPIYNIEENETDITVSYDFQGLNLLQDSIFTSSVLPRIKGFGFSHTPGTPDLPVKWDAIRLPSNSIGSVNIIDSSYLDIPMIVSPARDIRVCSDEKYTINNIAPITPYKGFFPSGVIPSIEQSDYHGVPILNVCLCPVKYNYETRTIRVFSRIKSLLSTKNR